MPIKVKYEGKELVFEAPVPVTKIVGDSKDIVCAYVNKRVRELTYVIDRDCEIQVLTCKDRDAKEIYEASLRFLVAMAMKRIHPEVKIGFTYGISRCIFLGFLNPGFSSSNHLVRELQEEMERIVKADYPLERSIVSKDDAMKIFAKEGELSKVEIIPYRPEKTCHIYTCDGYRNYMYNRMVPSTGYIKKWNLLFFHPGILIQYPRPEANGEIPQFEDAPMFSKILAKSSNFGFTTRMDTVAGLNKRIKEDGDIDVITLCEQIHNRQLCVLGDAIEKEKESIRIICIAGPSSSGKTTFANRLRIELLARGLDPIRISLDDYYKAKVECPKDENGDYDLESIDALDVPLFNEHMLNLIAGEEVTLPKYDFKIGRRVPGRKLKVGVNQPIIIEGIHALNDLMTQSIPSHQKFKIFIAPVAQMRIDDYNPLSLTDLRLLRRIVRDYQFRNASAIETMGMWPSVRKGEFKWIYKTQESANFVFNSFSPIELSIMKKYALPLLKEISDDSPYYPVAERLIRMLKFFEDMDDKWIPCNSILREFIGGSCYADV